MSLLVLENIVKEYGNQRILDNVSLRVERGERLALVGPNGAGKTTLLKIALGIEPHDRGRVSIARGTKVGYLSQDWLDEAVGGGGAGALHYQKIAGLEQKLRGLEGQMAGRGAGPDAGETKALLKEYARCTAEYEALDGYKLETKLKKILYGLGLRAETPALPLGKLSGGERMRVLVARLLLEEPDLLLLDEPTNHLDIRAAEWFESFLKAFPGGIMFASHDRYFLDRVATRVAELEKGSLCVRSGSYSDYLAYKQQLSEADTNEQKKLRWTLREAEETVQGLKSRGKSRASKSREKEIRKRSAAMTARLAATKRQEHLFRPDGPKIEFKKIKHVSKDIAWAENLRKSFGGVALFSGVDFHIRGRERIAIIGPNGSGKTTLLNLLLGRDNSYEGFLRLGEWVKFSYMGQHVLFENEAMTLQQLIAAKKDMPERDVRDYLARFQFYGEEIEKPVRVLSGGERVRLYLACVMLEDADCLILDEPTNHLDGPARDAVEAALRRFRGTVIAVTHDRYYLTYCVDKILAIEDGKITTYEGNYDFYRQVKEGAPAEVSEEKSKASGAAGSKKSGCRGRREINGVSANGRQEIEARIIRLEESIKAIEVSFDAATPAATYREYAELLREVERLYGERQ